MTRKKTAMNSPSLTISTLALSTAISAFAAEPFPTNQPGLFAQSLDQEGTDPFSASLEAGWTSRYIAEGRETFDDDGMATFLASLGYQDFSLELWQALSDGSSLREFQASAFYSLPTDPIAITIGLTHINDTRGGDEDLDLSLALSGELFLDISWETLFYYGFDRGGFYLESGISRTWETPLVDIQTGLHLGSNFGYVTEGHEGPDHFAISIDFSKQITDALTVSAGYSYIFAIDRDIIRNPEDEELFQGSLVSLRTSYSF